MTWLAAGQHGSVQPEPRASVHPLHHGRGAAPARPLAVMRGVELAFAAETAGAVAGHQLKALHVDLNLRTGGRRGLSARRDTGGGGEGCGGGGHRAHQRQQRSSRGVGRRPEWLGAMVARGGWCGATYMYSHVFISRICLVTEVMAYIEVLKSWGGISPSLIFVMVFFQYMNCTMA